MLHRVIGVLHNAFSCTPCIPQFLPPGEPLHLFILSLPATHRSASNSRVLRFPSQLLSWPPSLLSKPQAESCVSPLSARCNLPPSILVPAILASSCSPCRCGVHCVECCSPICPRASAYTQFLLSPVCFLPLPRKTMSNPLRASIHTLRFPLLTPSVCYYCRPHIFFCQPVSAVSD